MSLIPHITTRLITPFKYIGREDKRSGGKGHFFNVKLAAGMHSGPLNFVEILTAGAGYRKL